MTPMKGESLADFAKRAGKTEAEVADQHEACMSAHAASDKAEKMGKAEHHAVAATLHAKAARMSDGDYGHSDKARAHAKLAGISLGELVAQLGELKGVELMLPYEGKDLNGQVVRFTEQDLDGIAKHSEPDKVPVVLGHEEEQTRLKANLTPEELAAQRDTSKPAAGWGARFYREGNKLLGDFKDVPQSVMNWVKDKVYRKVSVELTRGQHGLTLRRVGLLGAHPPAIKGMADIPVALAESTTEVVLSLADLKGGPSVNRTQAVEVLKGLGVDPVCFGDKVPDEAVIALAASFKQSDLQGKVNSAVKLAEDTAAMVRSNLRAGAVQRLDAACTQAKTEGKLTPAEEPSFKAIALGAFDAAQTIKLGEKTETVFDVMLAQLAARPVAIKLGETAGDTTKKEEDPKLAQAIKLAEQVFAENPALHSAYSKEEWVENSLLVQGLRLEREE